MQNIGLVGPLDPWKTFPAQLEKLGFTVASVDSPSTLSNALSIGRPGTGADLEVPENADALRVFRTHLLQNTRPRVVVFAASTRTGSFNRQLAAWAARQLKAAGLAVDHLDLRDYAMPLYDGDLETAEGLPEATLRLQRLLFRSHGIFVSSPEYNGYFPPLLKNTLDWASRGTGDAPGLVSFAEQVVAVATASPGGLGGVRALPHVRQLFENLGALAMPGSVAVGSAYKVFAKGEVVDDRTAGQLQRLVDGLVSIIGRLNAVHLR